MADFTTLLDGTSSTARSGGNAAGFPAVTVLVGEYDATTRPLAAADTIALIPLPKGTFVHKVFVEVLNGEATQTLHVGDADDDEGYVASGDVATTGAVLMGAGAFSAGKFYTADGMLMLEAPATKAFTTLRVRVTALVCRLGVTR